ncbi:hypothetical protein B5V02_39380 [Mesorhizobium kowhaii]|uniref:Uncharacterized protein n=1 Tax=Mesorhizobium kowhaii TaxID=1300272 RepID=A0A2W7BS03_9HYPH|nr:hypothetical protein B5V02_39380 [Mesorhizobium kowhaii]
MVQATKPADLHWLVIIVVMAVGIEGTAFRTGLLTDEAALKGRTERRLSPDGFRMSKFPLRRR